MLRRNTKIAISGGILVIGLLIVFQHLNQIRQFDEAFDRGEVTIESNSLGFGQVGNPKPIEAPSGVPNAAYYVYWYPRTFETNGCTYLDVPPSARQLLAAIDSSQSGNVSITMPKTWEEQAVICSDNKQYVILWATK